MISIYFDDDKENRSTLKLESMPCYLLSIHNAKTFFRIIGNFEQTQGPVLSFKTIIIKGTETVSCRLLLQPVVKMLRHSHEKTTFLDSNCCWSQVCEI